MRPVAALLIATAALVAAGCAGGPQPKAPAAPGAPEAQVPAPPPAPPTQPPAAPFATLAARFADRALARERAGDLPGALDAWGVVAALRPGDEEPKRRATDVAARAGAEAERRYREGLARLQAGDAAGARREFLLALAADPDHAAALEALRTRLDPDAEPYTVVAGDTFGGIAKKRYGDAAKAAIVARVNNLDPAGKPSPGTTLSVPSLTPLLAKAAPAQRRPAALEDRAEAPEAAYETDPAAITPEIGAPQAPRGPDLSEDLARAAELLAAKRYEEAAAAADRLAGKPGVGARAREISGNAWFAIGEAAAREERYAEAVAAYRKAAPVRKDAAAAIAGVERRMHEKAEEQYSAGVRFFIDQKLEEAIRSWEQTLALNPKHPKAPGDLEKARSLQRKLQEIR